MLRLLLEHHGHTVIEARDGREGLSLFPSARAHLVITDLVMPEREGFDVLATLQKTLPSVKIIVISGGIKENLGDYLEMALRLGADKALAKPFSHAALLAAINELLPAAQSRGRGLESGLPRRTE